MDILIIGAGGMGTLFSKLMHEEHEVSVYDKDPKKSEALASQLAVKPIQKLEKIDKYGLVLLSVPISAISTLIEKLSFEMRRGSILVEIASIKFPVIEGLRKARRRGINTISLHPLFGPGIRDPSKGKAAIVEVMDIEEEISLASTIFPFQLIPTNEEEHDKVMAWLGLIHLILNSYLASSDEDAHNISKLFTTTLQAFTKLAASTLTQDSRLTQELIDLNPEFPKKLSIFLETLTERYKDIDGMRSSIKAWKSLLDIEDAYRSLYE